MTRSCLVTWPSSLSSPFEMPMHADKDVCSASPRSRCGVAHGPPRRWHLARCRANFSASRRPLLDDWPRRAVVRKNETQTTFFGARCGILPLCGGSASVWMVHGTPKPYLRPGPANEKLQHSSFTDHGQKRAARPAWARKHESRTRSPVFAGGPVCWKEHAELVGRAKLRSSRPSQDIMHGFPE